MAYTPPIDAGSCTYNGWTFSLFAKTNVTVKPVLDGARRTVTHNEHTVEVEDLIVPPSGESDVEALIDSARQLLTTQGGQLTISGKAYSLDVNNPGGNVRDVMYGPVPEIVELRPVGSRLAWSIKWRCVTNIPECARARYTGIMEFNHNWNVSIDEEGFTTRVVSGKLVIAATVLATGGARRRRPPDDADAYFERVVAAFPPVPNFKRSTTRDMSPDRRTLDFVITDTELEPSAFLPGVASWTGDQEVRRESPGWFRHTVTCTGSYTLAKGAAKTVALGHFLQLVRSRHARVSRNEWPVPLELLVRDELHSRKVSFTYRFLFASDADPAQGLEKSGIWLAVPNASWPAWAESMRQSVLHARGHARIFFNRQSDLLIDLCDYDRLGTQATQSLSASDSGGGAELRATRPPANRSWIHYEGRLEAVADDGVTVLRTLPLTSLNQPARTGGRDLVTLPADGGSLNSPGGGSGGGSGGGGGFAGENLAGGGGRLVNNRVTPTGGGTLVNNQGLNVTRPRGNDSGVHVQRRTTPLVRIRLVGRAIRWGWPIAPPRLLGALGVPAVLEHPRLIQKAGGLISGVPLVGCAWADTYVLQGARSGLLPFPPSLE